jgi:RNA polymerase sigma-70 factor, ECF subfamily
MEPPGDGERRTSTSGSISASLLERVRAQDGVAWRRLVNLYSPLVFSWCRRAGLNSEDASDVLQEVFIAVSRNVAQFRRERPGDTFRGWLRVIARNKIRLHFRRQSGQPEAAGGTVAQMRLQELPDVEAQEESDSSYEEADDRELFHRQLELIRCEFEPATWQAFWLVAVEQQSAADVAGQLQMTPGAVRQAKYKVLRKLRDELADLMD